MLIVFLLKVIFSCKKITFLFGKLTERNKRVKFQLNLSRKIALHSKRRYRSWWQWVCEAVTFLFFTNNLHLRFQTKIFFQLFWLFLMKNEMFLSGKTLICFFDRCCDALTLVSDKGVLGCFAPNFSPLPFVSFNSLSCATFASAFKTYFLLIHC